MNSARPFVLSRTLQMLAIGATLPSLISCTSTRIVVPGTSNIYGAGHRQPPGPAGGGAGSLPPCYTFPTATGNEVLTISRVSGQVVCDQNHFPSNGPDGGPYAGGRTDMSSYGGISGIKNRHATMFLVGVFLGSEEPREPAPPCLDFNDSTSFVDVYPGLRQTFFIGDGLRGTGTGELQRFHVPAGATRLFLGFVDGWASHDLPGWYGDNAGSLSVEFRFSRE